MHILEKEKKQNKVSRRKGVIKIKVYISMKSKIENQQRKSMKPKADSQTHRQREQTYGCQVQGGRAERWTRSMGLADANSHIENG